MERNEVEQKYAELLKANPKILNGITTDFKRNKKL